MHYRVSMSTDLIVSAIIVNTMHGNVNPEIRLVINFTVIMNDSFINITIDLWL